MSYDLEFDCGPLAERHDITGGTYALGGTTDPHLNITYNYHKTFYRLWPEDGIRHLYGMTAQEVINEINARLPEVVGEPDQDYWAATEGNARVALVNLRDLAALCPPDSKLSGD